jgi:hypothetical protein
MLLYSARDTANNSTFALKEYLNAKLAKKNLWMYSSLR